MSGARAPGADVGHSNHFPTFTGAMAAHHKQTDVTKLIIQHASLTYNDINLRFNLPLGIDRNECYKAYNNYTEEIVARQKVIRIKNIPV